MTSQGRRPVAIVGHTPGAEAGEPRGVGAVVARIWRHADDCRSVWARRHRECTCNAEPFIPERHLRDAAAALEQARVDMKAIAADATDEAREYVAETGEPRIRAAVAAIERALRP